MVVLPVDRNSESGRIVNVTIQISLADDLLSSMDRVASDRRALIEHAVRDYLCRLEKSARDARDGEIIDRCASRLNAEAEDVLLYTEFP